MVVLELSSVITRVFLIRHKNNPMAQAPPARIASLWRGLVTWVSVSSSSLTKQGLLFSHKLQETRAPLPKALLLALVLFGS